MEDLVFETGAESTSIAVSAMIATYQVEYAETDELDRKGSVSVSAVYRKREYVDE